jgi:hypothetical protein
MIDSLTPYEKVSLQLLTVIAGGVGHILSNLPASSIEQQKINQDYQEVLSNTLRDATDLLGTDVSNPRNIED